MASRMSPTIRYASLMEEIHLRLEVVDPYLKKQQQGKHPGIDFEFVCLQLRKILELVAFGSLVANHNAYSATHKDFASHWNAKLLLRDMARINPHFYPVPVKELPSGSPSIKASYVPITSGFLTQADFVKAYDRCGSVLHALNPYKWDHDRHDFGPQIPAWRNNIVALLNRHLIVFPDHPVWWVVSMGRGPGQVTCFELGPLEDHD